MATVIARQGDTLSGLLKSSGNPNWANPSEWAKSGLSDPNTIYPGQTINIPDQQMSSTPMMSMNRNASVPMQSIPNSQMQSTPNSQQPSPYGFAPNSAGPVGNWLIDQVHQGVKQMGNASVPTVYAAENNNQPQSQTSSKSNDLAMSSPQFTFGTPEWVKPQVQKMAEKYNLPTALLSSVLKQESGFNPNAASPAGAQGIAQIMPETAKALGINPWDPIQAIEGAAKYLRQQWDKFGKPELALAAYNAGPGAVQQYGGIPPYKETQRYVKNIMAMAGEPHESYNGPTLDVISQAKKQSQPQVQPNAQMQSMPAFNPNQINPQDMQYQNHMNQQAQNTPANWSGYTPFQAPAETMDFNYFHKKKLGQQT